MHQMVKNILIFVLKMNESLIGLERHESDDNFFIFGRTFLQSL